MKSGIKMAYSATVFGGGFLVVFVAGLLGFVEHVEAYATTAQSRPAQEADAIVVLTGGSERVRTGLELLRDAKGKKLLISGVHPDVEARQILAPALASKERQDCCIVLGHEAADTAGNASETLDFMRSNGFRSLLLVTAHYHMPRSLLLFRSAMPEVEMIPHAVKPSVVDLSFWWGSPQTISLLVLEYGKYLYARCSLALKEL